MIKRKYYKKNGGWRCYSYNATNPDVCQGCKHSVNTMKDKKFYQVRIDGVFKYRCWICYCGINGINKSNVEETARIGEYFETIF